MTASEGTHRRGAEGAEYPQSEVTERIIAAAIEVHRHLGPGLLESVYQQALDFELKLQGLRCQREIHVSVKYKGESLGGALRLDLLVEGAVIVEVKSIEALEPIHQAQLLTYLRLTQLTTGLLLNFNEVTLARGITRVVDPLRPSASSAPLR